MLFSNIGKSAFNINSVKYLMKILSLSIISILFSGCLYFNENGVSTHLYDDCKEYYDLCGNYHKECPKTLLEYQEVPKAMKDIKKEIYNYSKRKCSELKSFTN